MIDSSAIIIIAGWLVLVLICSTISSKLYPNIKELGRKVVHIGIGPLIPLAWWLKIPSGLGIIFSLAITITLIINYKLKFLPEVENIKRNSYGTIAYALSITLLFFLFWVDRPDAVTAGILTMSFGDGFAGLIGQSIRSPYWTILGQRKSLAGTMSMGIVVFFILLLMTLVTGIEINISNLIILVILSTLLEQISPWGIDNLTVPIGIAYVWSWLTIL